MFSNFWSQISVPTRCYGMLWWYFKWPLLLTNDKLQYIFQHLSTNHATVWLSGPAWHLFEKKDLKTIFWKTCPYYLTPSQLVKRTAQPRGLGDGFDIKMQHQWGSYKPVLSREKFYNYLGVFMVFGTWMCELCAQPGPTELLPVQLVDSPSWGPWGWPLCWVQHQPGGQPKLYLERRAGKLNRTWIPCV